jgi:NAD(P)-dependent dehydrogenase (short-subunit alcohol dehydrogenase family)
MVATGMARRNIENKNIFAVMQRATPWPRIGTAGDIAGVCMFLLLPQSQWMTGQILAVDGGMTLGIAS